MTRILAAIVCLLACVARGQTLEGASVSTNGFVLHLYFSGLGTNGTFSLGWARTNSQPGPSNTVVLTVNKPGFVASGSAVVATSHVSTLYAGHQMRFPHPGEAFSDTVATGTGVRVGVSLTDFIATEDTNLSLSLLAGVYSQGGTNSSSASSVTVTNNSLVSYGNAEAIANWSRTTSWNRWTNSPQRVYAVGFGGQRPYPVRDETRFKPLVAMEFIATDLFGNSVTNFVPTMTIDTGLGEVLPTARYQADLVLTGMSNRSPVRVDFVAYPHIGTTNSIFDTRRNTHTGVSGLPIAITNLWDPLQEYSQAVAIVDPAGSDTTGTVTTPAGYPTHTNYFLSIAKAAQAIRTNNAAHAWAHDDVGGGIVYVRDGITNWLGGSQSYGTNPLANIRITKYPGHAPTLTTVSGNQDISDRIELDGINIGGTGNLFSSINYLTIRNSTINSSNSMGLFATCPVIWLIDCDIPQVANGLRPVATHNTRFHLDGVDLTGFSGTLNPATMIGSYHPKREGASPFILQRDTSSGQQASTDYFIWYNNLIGGLQSSSLAWHVGQNTNIHRGGAVVQNVFAITTNAGPCVFNFGGSQLSHTNFIGWHNIFVGKRAAGFWYNQASNYVAFRTFISWVGNFVENFGYKTDDFTGDGGADGARIGNWSVMWSVGHRNNVHDNANTTGSEAPGSFVPYFRGITSYHPLTAFTNAVSWPDFVDPRSVGNASVEGEGNWRYNTTSPVGQQFQDLLDIPIPYDLAGEARSAYDPPGPYGQFLRPTPQPSRSTGRSARVQLLKVLP